MTPTSQNSPHGSPHDSPLGPPAATPIHGRGTPANPKNRFRTLDTQRSPEFDEPVPFDPDFDEPSPRTQLFADASRSILSENDSPDVPFAKTINPYRGCEHGCSYCYARPTHEFLGLSAGLDFETKLFVKYDAPRLLSESFDSPRWKPELLGVSGVTDAYQPIERKLQITRRCIEVCAQYYNPICIITKSDLVLRDIDLLKTLAERECVSVAISVTTLDRDLSMKLEPRACVPSRRLAAIERLSAAGIPVCVLVAPVIPGLNEHEIPEIIQSAAAAGARNAGYVILRLPHGLKDLFAQWLADHAPLRRDKVLHQLASMRDGQLNQTAFGDRMRGTGALAQNVRALFELACRRAGVAPRHATVSTSHFRRPRPSTGQLTFFDA